MQAITFDGTIDVTIADAQINLSQHGSKQDPYCIVTLGSSGIKRFMEGETLGKEKFQTKVHDNAGQHPVWNETHSMSLNNMTTDSHLKIKIWDKDVVKDDSMAIAKINLSQLLTNDKKGVVYYPLYKKTSVGDQPKEGEIGQIGVGVVFHSQAVGGDVKTHQPMGTTTTGATTGMTGPVTTGATTGAMTGPVTTGVPTGTTTSVPTGTGAMPGPITGSIGSSGSGIGSTGYTGVTNPTSTGLSTTGPTTSGQALTDLPAAALQHPPVHTTGTMQQQPAGVGPMPIPQQSGAVSQLAGKGIIPTTTTQ